MAIFRAAIELCQVCQSRSAGVLDRGRGTGNRPHPMGSSRAIGTGLLFVAAMSFAACGRSRRAVDDCIAAHERARAFDRDAATGEQVADESRHLVETCAEMYSNAACRAGMKKAWSKETDPSQRLHIQLESCRDAYCPELPEPKPALCTSDLGHAVLNVSQTQWVEFDEAVLERDLSSLYPRLKAARQAMATRR